MDLLAGVDIGTSSSKVSIINAEGNVVVEASSPHETKYLDEIRIEQNPDDWIKSVTRAFRKLRQKVNLKNVRAIAFTGQMISLVCIDKEGRLVRPAITWMDQRSQSIIQQLRTSYKDYIKSITYNPANIAYTLPRILWVKKHEPDKWSRTWKVLLPKDYVKFRFCGETITDFSDASGTLLFDVSQLKWSKEIMHLFSIDSDKMPDVASSSTVIGKIDRSVANNLGLSEEVFIVNGCSDLIGESYVAFLLNPRHILIRFGSAGSVSTVISHPYLDPSERCTCYTHAADNKWVVETSSQGFGVCEHWLRERILNKSPGEVFKLLDTRTDLLKSSKLLFIPPIKGAPYWEPKQTGSFIGLSLDMGGLEMLFAVLEGICFSLKDAHDQLLKMINNESCEYFFVGGGTQSKIWTEVLANILGVSSKLVKATPSIGAAFIAAKALGWDFEGMELSYLIRGIVESSEEFVCRYSQLHNKYTLARESLINFITRAGTEIN